jgi:putative transposase
MEAQSIVTTYSAMWKDKKEVVADLKTIYTAINAEEAKKNLNALHTKWDERNLTIANSWELNIGRFDSFFIEPRLY